MHKTMFTTPILNFILRRISFVILKLAGWKLEGEIPKDLKKCVVIAAPHTSNWDFPFTLLLAFAADMPMYWMGKKELFKFPFGFIMRFMGGVSVDRGNNSNGDLITSSADALKNSSTLYLLVQPEGTRSKVVKWKTGFHRISTKAEVPILLGFLDFSKKTGGFLGVYNPSDDIESDITEIRQKYTHIRGKHSDRES